MQRKIQKNSREFNLSEEKEDQNTKQSHRHRS